MCRYIQHYLVKYDVRKKRQFQTNVVTNSTLKDSVATHLRCGGIFNNNTATYLLLSLPVKHFLNRWTFGKVTGKKGDCFTHFMHLATTLLKDKEFTRHVDCGKERLLLTAAKLF